MGFDINASGINNHSPLYPGPGDWTGAEYGANIGIWFHPVTGLSTSYDNGYLSSLTYTTGGWLDINNRNTVPEPGTMLVLGLGGLGILARRRRAKKA